MNEYKPNVLIVDDDPMIVQFLKVNLEAEDYNVDVAYDGEEALSKVFNKGSNRPDLVILDLMLPKVDGYKVAREIRKKKAISDIPIIMLTAKDQPLDKIEGLIGSDADYYLTKPVNIGDLLIHVYKALSKKEK